MATRPKQKGPAECGGTKTSSTAPKKGARGGAHNGGGDHVPHDLQTVPAKVQPNASAKAYPATASAAHAKDHPGDAPKATPTDTDGHGAPPTRKNRRPAAAPDTLDRILDFLLSMSRRHRHAHRLVHADDHAEETYARRFQSYFPSPRHEEDTCVTIFKLINGSENLYTYPIGRQGRYSLWLGDLDQPNLLLRLEHDPAAAFTSICAELVQVTGYTTGNGAEATGYIHLNAVLDSINDMIRDHDLPSDAETQEDHADDLPRSPPLVGLDPQLASAPPLVGLAPQQASAPPLVGLAPQPPLGGLDPPRMPAPPLVGLALRQAVAAADGLVPRQAAAAADGLDPPQAPAPPLGGLDPPRMPAPPLVGPALRQAAKVLSRGETTPRRDHTASEPIYNRDNTAPSPRGSAGRNQPQGDPQRFQITLDRIERAQNIAAQAIHQARTMQTSTRLSADADQMAQLRDAESTATATFRVMINQHNETVAHLRREMIGVTDRDARQRTNEIHSELEASTEEIREQNQRMVGAQQLRLRAIKPPPVAITQSRSEGPGRSPTRGSPKHARSEDDISDAETYMRMSPRVRHSAAYRQITRRTCESSDEEETPDPQYRGGHTGQEQAIISLRAARPGAPSPSRQDREGMGFGEDRSPRPHNRPGTQLSHPRQDHEGQRAGDDTDPPRQDREGMGPGEDREGQSAGDGTDPPRQDRGGWRSGAATAPPRQDRLGAR